MCATISLLLYTIEGHQSIRKLQVLKLRVESSLSSPLSTFGGLPEWKMDRPYKPRSRSHPACKGPSPLPSSAHLKNHNTVMILRLGVQWDSMAQSVKVPADKFKAAIRALLNTPPMPASEITDKRQNVSDEGKRPGPKPKKRR